MKSRSTGRSRPMFFPSASFLVRVVEDERQQPLYLLPGVGGHRGPPVLVVSSRATRASLILALARGELLLGQTRN